MRRAGEVALHGAFVLAQTSLLDGRRATTHWVEAANFAQRFPKVVLDAQVLFVDEERVVMAAGASACLDMCLTSSAATTSRPPQRERPA